jgi:hypothetical protein
MGQLLARSCCTTPAAIAFWAASFVIIYGAALLLASVWPAGRVLGDTLILIALAVACFLNFGRNRTLHCGITAPIFLLGAVAAALIEVGAWRFEMAVVWALVLVGAGIALVIEWRTVGQNRSNACDTRQP